LKKENEKNHCKENFKGLLVVFVAVEFML